MPHHILGIHILIGDADDVRQRAPRAVQLLLRAVQQLFVLPQEFRHRAALPVCFFRIRVPVNPAHLRLCMLFRGLQRVDPALDVPGLPALFRRDVLPVRNPALLPAENIEIFPVQLLHLLPVQRQCRRKGNAGILQDLFQLFRPPVVFHHARAFHDLRVQAFDGIHAFRCFRPEHPVHQAAGNRNSRGNGFSQSPGIQKLRDCFLCHAAFPIVHSFCCFPSYHGFRKTGTGNQPVQ